MGHSLKSWTHWSLLVPSNSDHSVILWPSHCQCGFEIWCLHDGNVGAQWFLTHGISRLGWRMKSTSQGLKPSGKTSDFGHKLFRGSCSQRRTVGRFFCSLYKGIRKFFGRFMPSKRKFLHFWGSSAALHFKAFWFAEKKSKFALLGTFLGQRAGLHEIQVFSGYFEEASLMFPCASLFWKVL